MQHVVQHFAFSLLKLDIDLSVFDMATEDRHGVVPLTAQTRVNGLECFWTLSRILHSLEG